MNLSKLYALLNAVPIVAGGAQAVMDAVMQKNMTFPQAVADRINEPYWASSIDYIFNGADNDLPLFETPFRDFEPIPERPSEISGINNAGDEPSWQYGEKNWHYDDYPGGDGLPHPPGDYYRFYTSPTARKRMAKNNNQLFQQYPKLLEAFKEWRSK